LFTLGAAAIAGLPPLNGFVSEWLVYLGLFDAVGSHTSVAWIAIPAVVLLAMTGALALACFVKVCGVVFLGLPRSEAASRAHESGFFMRVPMLALAAACVAIGLAPMFFWPAIARAAAAWRPDWVSSDVPAPVATLGSCNIVFASLGSLAAAALWTRVKRNGLSRAGTWDCGYAAPSPRMQYTAGSFAGIITSWFAWILRPERHEQKESKMFPSRASLTEHTPETVLEKIVEPFVTLVMSVSTAVRRLQHGRVQAYILYLVIGLAALAILVLIGGAK
jgi:hydrogenase-4 component B